MGYGTLYVLKWGTKKQTVGSREEWARAPVPHSNRQQ